VYVVEQRGLTFSKSNVGSWQQFPSTAVDIAVASQTNIWKIDKNTLFPHKYFRVAGDWKEMT
jgi:hypothetical protein